MYVGGNSALKGFLFVYQLVQLQKQIQKNLPNSSPQGD